MDAQSKEKTLIVREWFKSVAASWKLYCVALLLLAVALSSVLMVVTGREGIFDGPLERLGLISSPCGDNDGCFGFYNVGNGDAGAVYTNHAFGMIDTGTSEYGMSLCEKIDPLVDKVIDFVIISHPHDDHAGGYEFLLEHYRVSRLFILDYKENQLEDYAYYQRLLTLSEEHGVEVIHPTDRSVLEVDRIRITFYRPTFFTADENERCLTTMIETGGVRCLYMGDGGLLTEDVLVSRGYDVSADLLKIGHHGSKTASGEAFLSAVDPAYGVICVGYNNYGHPSPEVLERLNKRKIPIYRTDSFSAVVFAAKDGKVTPVT